jgi:hypothetical protein
MLLACVVEPDEDLNDVLAGAVAVPVTGDAATPELYLGCAHGRIDPATSGTLWSDPDYWSFQAQQGDLVSIRVGTPDSNVDPYVELRSAAGTWLASDSDSGPGNDAFISAHPIPSTGTYYVRVGKGSASTVAGSYEMHIDLARGIGLEKDPANLNETVINQVDFAFSGTTSTATVAGTVSALDNRDADEDRFALGSLSEGYAVELELRLPASSTLVPRLRVVNSESGEVLPDQDGDLYDNHFWGRPR